MKTLRETPIMREMRFLLEIVFVQDATDFSDTRLWFSYIAWEASRKWLIDVNRKEAYCHN